MRFNLKQKCDYYMGLAEREYYHGDKKKCKEYFIKALKKMNESIYQYQNSNKKTGDYVVSANPELTYKNCIESGWGVDFSTPWWFKDKRSKNFLVDKNYKRKKGY